MRLRVLLASMLLISCSGSEDEPFFPLRDGRQWTYEVTTTWDDPEGATERELLRIRSEAPLRTGDAVAWRRVTDTGAVWWLRSDASGVFRVAAGAPGQDGALRDDPVRYVLHRPYLVGTTWETPTMPYVLRRRNETPHELRHLRRYQNLAMAYRIEQVDAKVSTKAGSFEGCLLVVGVAQVHLMVDELFAFRDVPIHTKEWYCPGAGLVRQVREERSPTKFVQGGTVTLDLVRRN